MSAMPPRPRMCSRWRITAAASSTGEAFLDQVGARVALVSCSSGSRYLPGEATLERLARSGAQVLRTDACGDITLTLHGGQLCITPYKARWAPVNHTAFFDAVKAGRIAGCYLFEGAEEYIKQQALKNLCARLLPEGLEQMNLTDLTDPAPDALIAAAETLPFLAEKRVVVVRECALLTAGRKAEDEDRAAALSDYIPRIPPTACVVFYVKGKADGRKKLYTLLKKQNAIVDFSPMNDAECADWCVRALRRMGKRLSGENAARLVFTVGRDAALLRQEMDKLCAYLGEREEIAAEDIDQICTRSTECTVFQMVDAQVAGNNDTAFALLGDMLRSGEDRVGILAMLLRQYRILYHMRCLMDERTPQASQAQLLGIPPFAVGRTQQQARRFDKARLRAAYDFLLDYEYRLKQGRVPQEGCAESALLYLEGTSERRRRMHEPLTVLPLGGAHPDLARVKRLYESAFPANERRPFEALLSGFRRGRASCSPSIMRAALRALSACSAAPTSPIFSTLPSRSRCAIRGWAPPRWNASRRLKPGQRLIADLEAPLPDAPNRAQRLRRRAFYQRAGFVPSGVSYRWQGETYELMVFGGALERGRVSGILAAFRRDAQDRRLLLIPLPHRLTSKGGVSCPSYPCRPPAAMPRSFSTAPWPLTLRALGVARDLRPGMHVLLKPNLLAARDPALAVTTHPEVLAAVARWLRAHGISPHHPRGQPRRRIQRRHAQKALRGLRPLAA